MKLGIDQTGIDNKGVIVFIHGAGLPGWSWKKQIDFFKEDYLCITIDLPDHGKSRNIPFTTIETVADELIETINDIQPNRKVNLVGHSLGAKLVIYILARDKLDINKVIISSALFNKSRIIEMMSNETLIKWSIGLIKKNDKMRKMQIKSFKFNDEEMESKMNEEYKMLNIDGYKRYMQAFTSAMEIPKELCKRNIDRILITYGSKEIKGIKQTANELEKNIKGSKSICLKGCNHLYPINRSKEYNDIIKDWLEKK